MDETEETESTAPQKQAFGLGYIISDADGHVQLHTLRSNRAESWQAVGALDRKHRDKFKAAGYRCVFVKVQEVSDQ